VNGNEVVAMGANKTYQQKSSNRVIIGESHEFRRLRHAIEKAHGDRERAVRNVCRLYGVKALDAKIRMVFGTTRCTPTMSEIAQNEVLCLCHVAVSFAISPRRSGRYHSPADLRRLEPGFGLSD
jgi:hypothetical protein